MAIGYVYKTHTHPVALPADVAEQREFLADFGEDFERMLQETIAPYVKAMAPGAWDIQSHSTVVIADCLIVTFLLRRFE